MMKEKDTSSESAAALRKRAEALLLERSPQTFETLSPEKARELLHELQVHQIESEMQNEELQRLQMEMEASRARYFDLYDLAPVGYLTVCEAGLIRERNFVAAGLLGVSRRALNKPYRVARVCEKTVEVLLILTRLSCHVIDACVNVGVRLRRNCRHITHAL